MNTVLEKWLESDENRRIFEQEGVILSVTEEIWRVMQERKVSKKDLADYLKCSKAHVTQLLNGNRNMTLRTLSDICGALGHHPIIQLSLNALRKPTDGKD